MTEISPGSMDKRRVPAWVGVLLVAICVVAGGVFIWWVVRTPLSGGADFIPDANGPAYRPLANFRRPRAESIRKTSENHGGTYQVKANGAVMDVEVQGPTGAPRFTYRYEKQNLIPKEQEDILLMKYRIVGDSAVAKLVGLTEPQRQKLSKISIHVTNMELPAADRDKLAALWQNYYTAKDGKTKSEAEKSLLASLKKIGKDNIPVTRKRAAERVEEIKSILSAEQIKKFQDMK